MNTIEQIKQRLPKSASIIDANYEGSEIILYTENADFFKKSAEMIKPIVNQIKKRIEVRASGSILKDEEKTEEFIKKTVPKEAEIMDVYFEPEFAKVYIHAKKPGLVIGKNGSVITMIRNYTLWTPEIRRTPIIDSEVIRTIRRMLHKEAGYRKKFLHKLGKRIYEEKPKEIEWIRLTALGGFREVGKSCMFLQTPNTKVLIDAGLSVKPETKPFPYLEAPEFHIQDLDAIILSHSHLDHCGVIPYLYEYGYRGPLYCTAPTRDTMVLILLDYVKICQRENKKPIYTTKGIEEAIKHCVVLSYGEVTDITSDMRLTLQSSGHLLGAATVHIHIGDGLYNILYTGDLKYGNTKLFDKASTDYTRVEGLIIESTYGSEEKLPHSVGVKALIESVKKVIARDGKALIPSFAVGRGQEVVAILAETNIDVPIYLDGMVWDATAIHTAYPEFMSKSMQNKILHKSKNPFIDTRLKSIGSLQEREKVLKSSEPCVVIATSGMLVGGPAIEYLKAFAGGEKNALIFVGYQAEGTLGRRIQKGWKRVQVENSSRSGIDLNLEIITIGGLGGHSEEKELLNFVKNLKTKPKKVLINHGEGTSCVNLAKKIHKTFKIETMAPKNLETVRFK